MTTKPDISKQWASSGDKVQPLDSKIQQGWTPEIPPHEVENWLQNRQDQFLAHINEFGIPEWDSSTSYPLNGMASVDGIIYRSLIANNSTNDPTVDSVNWEVAFLAPALTLNSRNRIVNPSMAISQENRSSLINVPSGTTVYPADEIFTLVNGSVTSGSLDTQRVDSNGIYSTRVTVNTAISDFSGDKHLTPFGFLAEAANVVDLNNGNVMLSGYLSSSFTGKVSIRVAGVIGGGTQRSWITTIDSSPTKSKFNVLIPFETNTVNSEPNAAGLRVYIGAYNNGTFKTALVGQWQDGSFMTAADAHPFGETVGEWIELEGKSDLYAGNVPREFVPNSYAQDLAECQRHWRKSWELSVAVGTAGSTTGSRTYIASGTASIQHTETYSPMRTSGVVTLFSPTTGSSGTSGLIRDVNAPTDVGASASQISEAGFKVLKGTPHVDQRTYDFHYTVNARLN